MHLTHVSYIPRPRLGFQSSAVLEGKILIQIPSADNKQVALIFFSLVLLNTRTATTTQ